ncbi:MAG: hypothetical protein JW797_05455 [Bradymonadales bacterium]|nr:hypothetical protein [Bradymonadales bacterium]
MRRLAIGRWLLYQDPQRVVEQLGAIVESCFRANDEARVAQLAWVDFLLAAGEREEIPLEALELAAERQQNRTVLYMLVDPPPHRQIKQRARQERRPNKPVPLGMRKWQAALHSPKILEVLLTDTDPAVIGRLCQNPSVREADAVLIASRRPTFSDILDAVARSHWLYSLEVQRALIQNPYVRTGLAIGLLPQHGPRFLITLSHSGELHPTLREAVGYFLTLCPPTPCIEETT